MGDFQLFAHSASHGGQPEPLADHLQLVANMAADYAAPVGLAPRARLAGILHDAGKAAEPFQMRVLPGLGKFPHSAFGPQLFPERGWLDVQLAIAGHHSGLTSPAHLYQRIKQEVTSANLQFVHTCMGRLFPDLNLGGARLPEWVSDDRRLELATRFLFSCLVDADYLATERHFHPELVSSRQSVELNAHQLLAKLLRAIGQLPRSTPMSPYRTRVLEACLQAAGEPRGVFALPVPTGGGKTLASVAFALRHCQCHDLRRIIVAVPYLSIIDQTVRVYQEIFGEDAVLAHHSGMELHEDADESLDRHRLAAENWDAPIVVTTTVQLFESLAANRPTKCRKVHRMAKSVVIIDEVQTLPVRLIDPISCFLQQIVDCWGCTVVLSTATPPSLEQMEGRDWGFRRSPTFIVDDPDGLSEAMRRVTYHLPADETPMAWTSLAQRLSETDRVLCVVNTTRQAQELWRVFSDLGSEAFHLSTRMCPAHRLETLSRVKERLEKGEPCRLISTQCVEAGVDVDFPSVYRAMAPLDSIVQAAGRCNREWTLQPPEARVFIFHPEVNEVFGAAAPPGVYKAGIEALRVVRPSSEQIDVPTTLSYYFRQLYSDRDTDACGIQGLRAALDFPEVAARFRIIDEDTVPVLVPWTRDGEEIVAYLASKPNLSRGDLRRAGPYTVAVRRSQLDDLLGKGVIRGLGVGLFVLGEKAYDPDVGLVADVSGASATVV